MRLSRMGQLLSGWPRRLLALACLLLAALSAVHTTQPTARTVDSGADVVIATRDLAAGAIIDAADLRLTRWPATQRPANAIPTVAGATGRRLAGPVGSGELLTTGRLVGSELTAGLAAGMIAAPVPLVDQGAVGLIRAGDHVNLLSPPSDTSQPAKIVASGVLVLAVLPGDPTASAAAAQLVVAVDQPTELRIAQLITVPMLATVIKPP